MMFQSLTQRFVRSVALAQGGASSQSLSSEPAEFETKYARLLQSRSALKKIDTNLRSYFKRSQALSKQAKILGRSLGTSEAEQNRLGEELNTALEEDALLHAITSKIQLLDDTVKQRRRLEDMRLVRDHHLQRLNQLESKRPVPNSPDEQRTLADLERRRVKLDQAQAEYDSHLAELTEALEFIDAQTLENGPWALIAVELDAFRTATQRLFANMQAILVGAAPGTFIRDPEAEKAAMLEEQQEQFDDAGKSPKSRTEDNHHSNEEED